MPYVWTLEALAALEPSRLERVRQNASAKQEIGLVKLCEGLQESRKPKRNASGASTREPVVGFHFVCKDDYEVVVEPDGTFLSGVWAINDALCDPAIEIGGYVALHDNKNAPSYRQGRIVGWRSKERTKGRTALGVEFRLEPLDTPIKWYGRATGEKGYRRVTDEPRWEIR